MNEAIKKMLEAPGLYAVGQPGGRTFTMIEVDEHGQAHQLTPKGKRDGILHPDRWSEAAVVLQARRRDGNQA